MREALYSVSLTYLFLCQASTTLFWFYSILVSGKTGPLSLLIKVYKQESKMLRFHSEIFVHVKMDL